MKKDHTYKFSLTESMNEIAKIKNSFFIGQGVVEGGHGMFPTLEQVEKKKKIELPVFEELQTGIALGLAMDDHFVVSIYPRFDFFLLGFNQLINHADKKGLAEISAETKALAGLAKERKLQPDQIEGSTFTISNLGMFGIEEFTAIINPPIGLQ